MRSFRRSCNLLDLIIIGSLSTTIVCCLLGIIVAQEPNPGKSLQARASRDISDVYIIDSVPSDVEISAEALRICLNLFTHSPCKIFQRVKTDNPDVLTCMDNFTVSEQDRCAIQATLRLITYHHSHTSKCIAILEHPFIALNPEFTIDTLREQVYFAPLTTGILPLGAHAYIFNSTVSTASLLSLPNVDILPVFIEREAL